MAKKLIGKILILDSNRKFGLPDYGHAVHNCGLIATDEILEALMEDDYDLTVIVHDDLATGKIQAVPEGYRPRILLVSFFGLTSPKEEDYRKLGIVNFAEPKGITKSVQDFLLLKEKERKKEKADEQKKKPRQMGN